VAQARSEGIEFNPDGTISLTIDGTVRHLRRPKLREYRYWAEQLRDLAKEAQAEATRLVGLLDQLQKERASGSEEEAKAAEEALASIQDELDEANKKRVEYSTPWTSGVVAQFSEKPLPEDPDDWPSWLALDVSIPSKILGHWKKSPLAPGASGTN
jgi:hypothetical protein